MKIINPLEVLRYYIMPEPPMDIDMERVIQQASAVEGALPADREGQFFADVLQIMDTGGFFPYGEGELFCDALEVCYLATSRLLQEPVSGVGEPVKPDSLTFTPRDKEMICSSLVALQRKVQDIRAILTPYLEADGSVFVDGEMSSELTSDGNPKTATVEEVQAQLSLYASAYCMVLGVRCIALRMDMKGALEAFCEAMDPLKDGGFSSFDLQPHQVDFLRAVEARACEYSSEGGAIPEALYPIQSEEDVMNTL